MAATLAPRLCSHGFGGVSEVLASAVSAAGLAERLAHPKGKDESPESTDSTESGTPGAGDTPSPQMRCEGVLKWPLRRQSESMAPGTHDRAIRVHPGLRDSAWRVEQLKREHNMR